VLPSVRVNDSVLVGCSANGKCPVGLEVDGVAQYDLRPGIQLVEQFPDPVGGLLADPGVDDLDRLR
jgi:hypothetical protein